MALGIFKLEPETLRSRTLWLSVIKMAFGPICALLNGLGWIEFAADDPRNEQIVNALADLAVNLTAFWLFIDGLKDAAAVDRMTKLAKEQQGVETRGPDIVRAKSVIRRKTKG